MVDFRQSTRVRRQNWFGAKRPVKRALSLPGLHHAMRTVAPRVPGVEVRRLPAPASLREVRGVVDGGEYVLLDPARCEIAKELYWGRGRRPHPADALALDVVVALTSGARTFLDVGAYTGVFTLVTLAAHPGLRAHAFEIVPPVIRMLQANLRRNGLEDRAVVHAYGLGDPQMRTFAPREAAGPALPSYFSADLEAEDGAEVRFASLDSLTEEVRPPVVMKIDVEGAEAAVFRHGQRFLARHRPDVLCEVLPGADAGELERLLDPHGLRRYLLRDDGLAPRERVEPEPGHRDWLLSRRSPRELTELGLPLVEP